MRSKDYRSRGKILGSRLAIVGAAAVMCCWTGHVEASTIVVVPNGNETVAGNSNNGFPFSIGDGGLSSQRYQQVYAASDFAAISGPQYITQIAFRPDEIVGQAFETTLTNVQINLSTTSAVAQGLSATFASNVGGDDLVVHSGSLTLSSAFTGAGPKDFDIVINLSTPFLYDPANGNLLLDVRNFEGGSTILFDAQDAAADSVSRAYTQSSGVLSTEADETDKLGLVTQFTFENSTAAVPEPGTLTLCGIAIAGLSGYAWRRRKT